MHTEGEDSMAERAGEIESSVRIPFTQKLDCLVGHARSLQWRETTQIKHGETQSSVR